MEVNYLEEVKKLCNEKMVSLNFNSKPEYEKLLKKEMRDLDDWPAYGNVNMAKRLYELKQSATVPAQSNKSGSLMLFLLEVSAIDPVEAKIPHDVVALATGDCPDIDTDFDPRYRGWVKELIVKLFSEEKTCSIGSYQTYKTKAVIVDVSRALGLDVFAAMEVTKKMNSLMKVEDEDGEDTKIDDMEWEDIQEIYPELKHYFLENPEVLEHCKVLRNQVKNMGKHAGGMIISNFNLQGKIPVVRDKSGQVVSSWCEGQATHELSEVGLVKFDILGLSNLSVMADCVALIEKTRGKKLTKADIPLNNKEAIKFGCQKDLVGIFQFESPATKPIVDEVGVDSIFDISAVTSLLRPGPKDMDMHMEYARRKSGQPYTIPACLKEVLDETYGVITYQEQVMKVAQCLSNFSPVESNKLRSAISKKKLDQLPKIREKFIKGAQPRIDRGEITKEEVEGIWTLLQSFGGYGFNRSHAVSYSAVTAAELWLKYNFKTEYMTAIFNNTKMNKKKHDTDNLLVSYINYSRANGINVLNPDINLSDDKFTIPEPHTIRYALDHIKMVGKCAGLIFELKPYKDFEDFMARIPKRKVNKKVLSHLIFAGAFDEFGKQMCITQGKDPNDIANCRNAIQREHFRLRKKTKKELPPEDLDCYQYWEKEKEVLGLSLSRPPLMNIYGDLVAQRRWTSISQADFKEDAFIFGRVEKIVAAKSKAGNNMRKVYITDDINEMMFFVFEKGIRIFQNNVQIGDIVAIPTKKFEKKTEGPYANADTKTRFFNSSRAITRLSQDEIFKAMKKMQEKKIAPDTIRV